jgi:nicotinate (nicotinamide) nucleotide adenylyltransferase
MNEDTAKILNLQSLISITNKKNIGILGGSFNPAHLGHIHISKQALEKIKLDYMIWLVALQNPFKPDYGVSIFDRAKNSSRIACKHNEILITTAESEINAYNTFDVLKILTSKLNVKNLTWVMGMDNLEHFNTWENFDLIPSLCDIAIFDRPHYLNDKVIDNFKSQICTRYNEAEVKKHKITIYISHDLSDLSSTAIRLST